ncbi:hypothetical protein K3495_g14081 [Podosphaera aphanis]|nr:hypothetical protein K3495_g14081 [Podosphaera aphanis]
MNQSKIAAQLNISRKQVGYSLRRGSVTSKKARGRSPSLSSEDIDKIEEFIKESPENRQMTYFELANGPFNHLGVSERVIKSELEKRGFKRYTALNKPTTSPEIRRKQREWAEARIDWTLEQWMSILWSDEIWATNGHHSRRWVTRKVSILLFSLDNSPRPKNLSGQGKGVTFIVLMRQSRRGLIGFFGRLLRGLRKAPLSFGRRIEGISLP